MPRTILHVDMDAFYTSIEQRDHPEYRGRPVVVGADPRGGRGRGVVAAASYEARAFGVHSAMPISRAYRLCPQAIYLRGDMEKYGSVSHRLMDIFQSFTDLVEPISIDEAFLDVTGSLRLYETGRAVALAIKEKIRETEQLGASIGIAPNKFLAKIASDLEKPDGLVEVAPGEGEAFLRDLPVERLWGVGPRMAEELHKLGLYTIGALARLSREDLVERFGAHGEHLFDLARGRDDRPVVPSYEPKSLGQETTFEVDTEDKEIIHRTLVELAEAVARRLRKHRLVGRTVTLKFRDERFVTETRAETLPDPTDDAAELLDAVLVLLGRVRTEGRKVRLLGIYVGKLEEAEARPRQLRLFGREERKKRLNRTVDSLIDRFGEEAIRPGSLLEGASRREGRKTLPEPGDV